MNTSISEAELGVTLKVAAEEPSKVFPLPPPKTLVVSSPWNLSIVKVFSLDASEILYHCDPLYAWYVDVVVLKISCPFCPEGLLAVVTFGISTEVAPCPSS